MAPGIERITRGDLDALRYGGARALHRHILFAELYGAGPETLNNIVHQGDHIDLEAYAQHPATAEVNRNGQS